jgi:hypothetical protein
MGSAVGSFVFDRGGASVGTTMQERFQKILGVWFASLHPKEG